MNFDITDNGSDVVFVTTDDITGGNPTNSSNVFMVSTDGFNVTQVTNNTLGFLADPQIGANGSIVVFYSESDLTGNNAAGNREIFSINTDGTNLTQLTANNAAPVTLAFADDGSRIVYDSVADPFGSNGDFSSEIFVIDIDGMGHAQLSDGLADSVEPDISDNGSLITFASRADLIPAGNADGTYEVFVANADGTGLVQITASASDSGTYTSGAPGALEIAGQGAYLVFGSDANHTGDNAGLDHTIFWASTDGLTIAQSLRDGYVPPTITSRAADNPHIVNDGAGILFDSAENYSFDSTGTEDKIFTTVRD
jgi:Tol biopolymer transport system component